MATHPSKIFSVLYFLYFSSMKISFQTKEESKRQQEEEFLKLSPSERLLSFLVMLKQLRDLPTKAQYDTKDNFVIEIKSKND